MEELQSYDNVTTLVAENKTIAEKYIKKGSTPTLIFGFFGGWIKSFFYMFIAMFKGAADGGGENYGGMFRFFRAIIETAFFPFIYPFKINLMIIRDYT